MTSLALQSAFAASLKCAAPAPVGLAVYRNNRRGALGESLAATFAVTRRIVGENFFARMAASFIEARPPRSPVLHEYGEGFAAFVAAYEPAAELVYLPDVARIEWAWMRAYHGADATPLAATALAGASDEMLMAARLVLHPTLTLVPSAFPAGTIWEMNRDGGELRPIEDWAGQDVLVLRPALEVEVHVMDEAATDFLIALTTGLTLGAAIDAACDRHPDFDPAAHLAGLFALGAVIEIAFSIEGD